MKTTALNLTLLALTASAAGLFMQAGNTSTEAVVAFSNQAEAKPLAGGYGCTEADIAHYVCRRTGGPIKIDGLLHELPWQKAERSPRFVDMATGDPAIYGTHAAALWDDQYLYVGFWIEEPYVQARLTERDSLIFQENDVEIFIDGGDCYYEFEMNALGTIYEVFFIWRDAYKRGGHFAVPEFDILKSNALTFGGDYDRQVKTFWRGTHPRGIRWAFLNWDFPGLLSAVRVDGTLNNNADVDRGWTGEIAFPWKGMKWLAGTRSLPPKEGDKWKIFFGRFQLLKTGGVELEPSPGWSWNRHGVYDTHIPECFTSVQFTTRSID